MILAIDVSYQENQALVAGVLFGAWDACEPSQVLFTRRADVAAYVPGQFYKRELPCILALLKTLKRWPAYIIVDGYVYLGRERRPGLGKYLYDALEGQVTLIGVAKSRFKHTPAVTEVFRGGSRRPLYVTAAGLSESQAKDLIASMCGQHRVPAMLKLADKLSKQHPQATRALGA